MNPSALSLCTTLAALALTGAAQAQALPPGHPAAGAAVFQQCQSCHAVGPGAANGVGPSLNGVVGRHSASAPGFHYSSAMKGSGLVWTPANISRFIQAPSDVVPGTHMSYSGLASAQDRADVIAYLAGYGPDGQPRK